MVIKRGWGEVDDTFTNAAENTQLDSSSFSAHTDESADRYSDYLLDGPAPTDNLHNTRNLFDDSNSEDSKWLKSARKFLSRLR